MSLYTNLVGRLRNTPLTRSHGLLPLFEAVVNSIHAIEDAGLRMDEGKIVIEIIRSQISFNYEKEQGKRGPEAKDDIVGFKITDNGVGFNDDNMKSFETLDSEYKASRGGRGVGRLLWLKAFRNVAIESIFEKDLNNFMIRKFNFCAEFGVKDMQEEILNSSQAKTVVHLEGFREPYKKVSLKTASAIGNSLFEHCLWYFVREGGAPNIYITDIDENISLEDVFHERMHSAAVLDKFEIGSESFDLTHIKLRLIGAKPHSIAYCASNRFVKDENITGKIPGLHSKIKDQDGEFVYSCYVSSSFLDDNVRAERTDFNLDQDASDLFSEEISFSKIRDAVLKRASEYLREDLSNNIKKAENRIEKFVRERAPRYRPILSRVSKEQLIVDPDISDKDLDLHLYKLLSEIEFKFLSDGHDLMKPMLNEEPEQYEKRLNDYLKTLEDVKKSDLANYVSHRRVILDLLNQAIKKGPDGKYAREELIHKLIVPMRKDSDDIMFDSCNLWLIDERLAFHDYLASDKTLLSMPITNSKETLEPDVCALKVLDNPMLVSEKETLPLASIVVVEIKRPMRDDAEGDEKDPIEQTLKYLDRIRKGTVQTKDGRLIPDSDSIPGFCYVVCDVTQSIKERARIHQLHKTSDSLGYFGFNPAYNAYIEVISFSRLVNSAVERNKAFFDRLGLPTN